MIYEDLIGKIIEQKFSRQDPIGAFMQDLYKLYNRISVIGTYRHTYSKSFSEALLYKISMSDISTPKSYNTTSAKFLSIDLLYKISLLGYLY